MNLDLIVNLDVSGPVGTHDGTHNKLKLYTYYIETKHKKTSLSHSLVYCDR